MSDLEALDLEIATTYGAIHAPSNLAEILAKHGWVRTDDAVAKASEIAEGHQKRAVEHRAIAVEIGSLLPKGKRHMATAHSFKNQAAGAWEVMHAIREMGDAT